MEEKGGEDLEATYTNDDMQSRQELVDKVRGWIGSCIAPKPSRRKGTMRMEDRREK